MVTGICVRNTHLIYIDRNDLASVIETFEKRVELDKLAFVKSISAFSTLTSSKLKVVSSLLKPMTKVRGGYLFREGEPVTNSYLVKSGEFKVFKTVYTQASSFVENTDLIYQDPLRASKHNSEYHFKNQAPTKKIHQLENVQRNQFVGLEDLINGNKIYTVSVVCDKQAEVYCISRADFAYKL